MYIYIHTHTHTHTIHTHTHERERERGRERERERERDREREGGKYRAWDPQQTLKRLKATPNAKGQDVHDPPRSPHVTTEATSVADVARASSIPGYFVLTGFVGSGLMVLRCGLRRLVFRSLVSWGLRFSVCITAPLSRDLGIWSSGNKSQKPASRNSEPKS